MWRDHPLPLQDGVEPVRRDAALPLSKGLAEKTNNKHRVVVVDIESRAPWARVLRAASELALLLSAQSLSPRRGGDVCSPAHVLTCTYMLLT